MVERSCGAGEGREGDSVPDSSRVVSQARGWTVCPACEGDAVRGQSLE